MKGGDRPRRSIIAAHLPATLMNLNGASHSVPGCRGLA